MRRRHLARLPLALTLASSVVVGAPALLAATPSPARADATVIARDVAGTVEGTLVDAGPQRRTRADRGAPRPPILLFVVPLVAGPIARRGRRAADGRARPAGTVTRVLGGSGRRAPPVSACA
jgi:hypothetical protein